MIIKKIFNYFIFFKNNNIFKEYYFYYLNIFKILNIK